MTERENLVRRFYAELWNDRNIAAVNEILADNVRFRGSLGDEKQGHRGFLEYVEKVHTALADYRCTVERIEADGGSIIATVEFTGLHQAEFLGNAPSGKRISWTGEATFNFMGSLISEVYVLGDLDALQEQLGMLKHNQLGQVAPCGCGTWLPPRPCPRR